MYKVYCTIIFVDNEIYFSVSIIIVRVILSITNDRTITIKTCKRFVNTNYNNVSKRILFYCDVVHSSSRMGVASKHSKQIKPDTIYQKKNDAIIF